MRVLLRKWKSNQLPDTPSIWFLERRGAAGGSPGRCGAKRSSGRPALQPLLGRTQSSLHCILWQYICVSCLPGNPPLLDLFCDPARAFPVPMTALNSSACLLWWGWGPANASVFHLSSAGAGWGPRPGGWSLFWEVGAAVVHHIPKNNDFLLPIPPSFIALFIDICSVGLFRSISSYEEQMSQIPKNLSEGEREISRGLLISLPPFWQRNWKAKLLHFAWFCLLPSFYK